MDKYNPDADFFDVENGIMLLEAGLLVYESETRIHDVTRAWGFEDVTFHQDDATGAAAFTAYDPKKNAVIVSFRGTERKNIEDAFANAQIHRTGLEFQNYGRGEAHNGFLGQTRAVTPDIVAAIEPYLAQEPRAKVMVTGHSLGGAMTALFTAYCLNNDIPVDHVYTNGEPPSGDAEFADWMSAKLKESGTNYFRFVNNADIIPRVFPRNHHVGDELYFNHKGELMAGEDQGPMARFVDRWAARAKNLVTLGTTRDGPQAYSDHLAENYLGLLRLNRDTDI